MLIYACGLILLLVWFPSVVLLVAPVFHLKIAAQGHAALSTRYRSETSARFLLACQAVVLREGWSLLFAS